MCKIVFKIVNLCLIIFLFVSLVGCRFITGEKPIHDAAFEGNLKKVEEIINKDPAQVNIRDYSDTTPLYFASMAGHTEIVKFLLAHGANIELANNLGERPLAKAAKFKNYDTVKILLEHGAEVNCKDVLGGTPLHEATLQSGKEMVDLLISYGADVSARDKYESAPLHEAAMHNNIEAAKALIEHGADIFAKNYFDNDKYNRLFYAAQHGDNKAAEELDKLEVYYPPPESQMNKTPKEIALACGHKELAQYLQAKEEESLKKVKVDGN
jgi:ankyrin repeat protein